MRISIVTLIFILLFSCSAEKKTEDKEFLESLENNASASGVDEQLINSILNQIPSPLEISVILKHTGSVFNSAMLNSTDNASKYNTNFKKAINLGIYGTDLGYTNIFGQSQQGIKYITTIKSLANDLNIGQFFDVETIARLASNSKNLDSLLLITTQNFNSINHYLQSQGRDNLSVLLLTGGWLEAMQITCQTAAKKPTKELFDTIGEQKIILEQILLLFSFYENDANMASISEDLKLLKTAYEKVVINYTYKESTMEIVNGVAVIKDNSSTTIDITPDNVKEIQDLVNTIRNKIIN
ncbi:MAG: hypothetical protein MUF39_01995 [Cyclobacteriaceae bacterium]|jgi:hypothetical protein|nr:hypothetical protein [Cyclobacteriaceae bacterium]